MQKQNCVYGTGYSGTIRIQPVIIYSTAFLVRRTTVESTRRTPRARVYMAVQAVRPYDVAAAGEKIKNDDESLSKFLSKNILFMIIISKSKRNQMKCLKTRHVYIKFAQLTSNQQDVSFGPSCFFNRKTIFGCCFACPSEESPRNHWTLCRGRIRCSKQGKKKKSQFMDYLLFV